VTVNWFAVMGVSLATLAVCAVVTVLRLVGFWRWAAEYARGWQTTEDAGLEGIEMAWLGDVEHAEMERDSMGFITRASRARRKRRPAKDA
jgi:hypothetical protein